MKEREIMQEIRELSFSQGFYGRLYENLLNLRQYDRITYDLVISELEAQNFSGPVDLVLYLEG